MTEPTDADQALLFEKSGQLATITLNRPKQFNSFDTNLRVKMLEAVQTAEADSEIQVVIIKGNGRGFCAGADLGQGIPDPVSDQLNNEYKPFLNAMAQGNKIYMAQVHGVAAGIGAALAMNCDLVVMADDATLYMAFAAIGLIPDGGNTQLLLNAMGYHRALEVILEGKHISASDCHSFGIANKLVAADQLNAETREWAEKLCNGAPLAMGAAKRTLRNVGSVSYGDAISLEATEQDPLVQSQDFQNAVASFFKKEKPVFHGK